MYLAIYASQTGVQSTLSTQSMLNLGGLGAYPPEKFWKLDAKREFGGISATKITANKLTEVSCKFHMLMQSGP